MSKSSITLSKLDKLQLLELSDRDYLRIGAAYQQLFWENGHIPTVEVVYEFLNRTYPLEKIREYVETEEFQEKLERQGLKTDTIAEGILTPEQIMVANMELSLLDKRSIRTKLEEFGISTVRYEAWKRDPAFQNYLRKRAEQLFEDLDSDAYKALAKAVNNGDMKAVQMALEMKGKYAKNINLNVNVEQILVRVVEIIALHVHEPEILEAIAKDIEALNA